MAKGAAEFRGHRERYEAYTSTYVDGRTKLVGTFRKTATERGRGDANELIGARRTVIDLKPWTPDQSSGATPGDQAEEDRQTLRDP